MEPIFIGLTLVSDPDYKANYPTDSIGIHYPSRSNVGMTVVHNKYNGNSFFARESPEQIQKLINEAYEKESNFNYDFRLTCLEKEIKELKIQLENK